MKRWLAMLQFSLTTLLLLTACAGTWFRVWQQNRELARLERKADDLRSLDRVLRVVDRTQISVVALTPRMFDEAIWDVYLPQASMLYLATRNVDPTSGADAVASGQVPIDAGTRRIELRTTRDDKHWFTHILVDNQEQITVKEPLSWNESRGSSGGSNHSRQTTLPAGQRVNLFHRTFQPLVEEQYSDFPPLPRNGQSLWIMPN